MWRACRYGSWRTFRTSQAQEANNLCQRRHLVNNLRDLPSMRQNFVMRHHQRLRIVAQAIGHLGYAVGLAEYTMTDMFLLRTFAISGGFLIVVWQCLQPKVQMVTAFWNAVYSTVNVVQLMWLKSETVPEFAWEEARLYALLERHLAAADFYALLVHGEWLWLVDGAKLTDQDINVGETCLYFITVGTCDVAVDGRSMATLGPGDVVGEVELLNGDARLNAATVTACGSVRCLAVPVRLVYEAFDARPSLRRALDGLFVHALTTKLTAMSRYAQVRNYKAVLEVACTLDREPGMAEGVAAYRRRYDVDNELHAAVLDEVPQCVHRPFGEYIPQDESIIARTAE